MTKRESEQVIRPLVGQWANSLSNEGRQHPSFSDFKTWLHDNGYGHYLDFRSVMGADYDAEVWFDDEMKLMWTR